MAPDTATLDARIAELRKQQRQAREYGYDHVTALCQRRIDRLLEQRFERTKGAA